MSRPTPPEKPNKPKSRPAQRKPSEWGTRPGNVIEVGDLTAPNPALPLGAGGAIYIGSLGAIWMMGTLLMNVPLLAVPLALITWAAFGPLYRGLESLVHGAAHDDILGLKHRGWNDFLGNLFAGWAVFQSVQAFRPIHLNDHHRDFDGAHDPCRARMESHPDVQAGMLPTLWTTLMLVPAETIAFYKTAGANPLTLLAGLAWHGVLLILPAALLLGGFGVALFAWALIFIPVFTVTLPIVRTIAEVSEHDYRPLASDLSEVERTLNHEGSVNRAFHMMGDRWHIEHHAYPGLPQYRLHIVHARLIAAGLGGTMQYRGTPLGPVQTYSGRLPALLALPVNDNLPRPANDHGADAPRSPSHESPTA